METFEYRILVNFGISIIRAAKHFVNANKHKINSHKNVFYCKLHLIR